MLSQALRDARRYEDVEEKKIPGDQRPVFHFSARTGWLNDPNGFSFYQGKYHLFYQYHPYDSHWGLMHWGHAVSEDLLHWKYLPAAMAPDSPFDMDGCFSGSALELPDGRQMLMYTGVAPQLQTQCLAIGDGVDYQKYSKNPVIGAEDVPEGCSTRDFRDPKIWRGKDGVCRCVVANRNQEGIGQVLMYQSQDGFQWKFERVLKANDGRFGRMWECPDYFSLDGRQVLLLSAMDMLPYGFEYHNGNGTVCLIGHQEEETGAFVEEHDQAIDYGIDFYAAQTLLSPDGRRIMIGWMQNWDTSNRSIDSLPWFGQMSIPRELSIKNGRLYQQPVRELEEARGEEVRHERVLVKDLIRLPGVEGRLVDLELSIRPRDREKMYKKFAVRFAQDSQYHTAVSFRPYESVLKIDRKFSGSRRAIIHQRRSLVNSTEGRLKLRMILDRFSVEVFVNDGEQVLSATLYTDLSAKGISFYADGEAEIDVVKYELR